ncbi:MAG: PcfJ domain-containing protein, partial [Promethearchaeota archaeon]
KVWSNKIFNLHKLLKAFYNVPIAPAKLLHKVFGKNNKHDELVHTIREKGKFLKNIENLQPDYLEDDNRIMFLDSIKMAKKLGKIVNCSWGLKRLKQEHDDWAEEITNILFVEDNKKLNIKGVFYEFAHFSNFYLIKTTRGLALEGKRQKHCVGGYAGTVNSGTSAIYHIKGYTLQLGLEIIKGEGIGSNKYKVENRQLRGFGNKKAPDELVEEVNDKIKEFNKRFDGHDCLTKSNYTFNGDESRQQIEFSLGANEWEIFDLDKIDENGNPEQILVDETKVYNEGVEEAIGDFYDDDLVDEYFHGNGDDLPF